MDAVLNLGLPAPIDVQVSGMDYLLDQDSYQTASGIAPNKIRHLKKGERRFSTPQGHRLPGIAPPISIAQRASLVGLSQKEVVNNVITALTSNGMIAPSYWVDPKSGNPYLLTVQYPETSVQLSD